LLSPLTENIVIPCNLSLDLIARRPDLMAQIWRVESLGHQVGAAIADFYPNINLTGFIGLESVFVSRIFQAGSKTAGVQPALHLPIFTAGAIRANVKAQKALFDAAVDEYNLLLLTSAQEVADLLVLAKSIWEQNESQDKIIERAKERYELSLLRKKKGLDSLFETYAKQETWIQKEIEKANLIYNQYIATIKLIKSLGGGYRTNYIPLKALECQ
jgi:outer membrane protein TolC